MQARFSERRPGSAVQVGAMTERAMSRIHIRAALDLRSVRSKCRRRRQAQ